MVRSFADGVVRIWAIFDTTAWGEFLKIVDDALNMALFSCDFAFVGCIFIDSVFRKVKSTASPILQSRARVHLFPMRTTQGKSAMDMQERHLDRSMRGVLAAY